MEDIIFKEQNDQALAKERESNQKLTQIIDEHEKVKYRRSLDDPRSSEVNRTFGDEHKFVVFTSNVATQFVAASGNLYNTKQISDIKCSDGLQPVAHLNNGSRIYLDNHNYKQRSDCEKHV
jgi:hypothetical protein